MLDGVVESHTAAMLTPYADDPSVKGKTFWDPAQYQATVTELDKDGYQIFTHAIGDRSVRLALDSYQNMNKANGTNDSRARIEHIETITAEDIPRFGKLGVIPSMQPLMRIQMPILWKSGCGMPERSASQELLRETASRKTAAALHSAAIGQW